LLEAGQLRNGGLDVTGDQTWKDARIEGGKGTMRLFSMHGGVDM